MVRHSITKLHIQVSQYYNLNVVHLSGTPIISVNPTNSIEYRGEQLDGYSRSIYTTTASLLCTRNCDGKNLPPEGNSLDYTSFTRWSMAGSHTGQLLLRSFEYRTVPCIYDCFKFSSIIRILSDWNSFHRTTVEPPSGDFVKSFKSHLFSAFGPSTANPTATL